MEGKQRGSQPRLNAEERTLKSSEKDSIYISDMRVSICNDMVLTTLQSPILRSAPLAGRRVRKGRSDANKMRANENDGECEGERSSRCSENVNRMTGN